MTSRVFIDSHEAVGGIRQRMGYPAFRAAVLKAGRFSVFEATETAWRARLTPAEFVDMFCRTHKGCTPDTVVTRIEFTYEKAAGDQQP